MEKLFKKKKKVKGKANSDTYIKAVMEKQTEEAGYRLSYGSLFIINVCRYVRHVQFSKLQRPYAP